MIPKLANCGLCHKPVYEFSPIDTVVLGLPKKAYVVHKECKKSHIVREERKADHEVEPPRVITKVLPDATKQPSMPHSEQATRKRGRPRNETS